MRDIEVAVPAGNSFTDKHAQLLLDSVNALSLELAEVSGSIEEVAQRVKDHETLFADLKKRTEELHASSSRIDDVSQRSSQVTGDAARQAQQSLAAANAALSEVRKLVESVRGMESKFGGLETSVDDVQSRSKTIHLIAGQTQILALNATLEAARAGQAGKGFAVVASEVKSLARESDTAALDINRSVANLSTNIRLLIDTTSQTVDIGGSVTQGIGVINATMESFQSSIDTVAEQAKTISAAAHESSDLCEAVLVNVDRFGDGVHLTSENLSKADQRVRAVLDHGEELMNVIVGLGQQTTDTPFLNFVSTAARQIAMTFEDAVDSGRLSLADLFDDKYSPIPNTAPQQHMSCFTMFTDAVLPQIQEPALDFSPLVVFCAAVDRNGYLPTHNLKFSQPQRSDPVWNAANCRNRRLFADRTGLRAARNTKSFLLQAYRRDMGGGYFAMMKDLSVPIIVKGKHWGALRLAYRVT